MGTIRKRGNGYEVSVCVNRVRLSETLPTKATATAWMLQAESELRTSGRPDMTVGAAMRRYSDEVSPSHKGGEWEVIRLRALGKMPLAKIKLGRLKNSDLAEWRDSRKVAPGTVLREMNILHSVFESCRRDWGWLKVNPLKDVKRPKAPPSRKRRITDDEIAMVLSGLNYQGGTPKTISQRIALMFLFALETAMRSGEMSGLQWADVGDHSVTLQATKNGDIREVPLSKRAKEIISLLPNNADYVFNVTKRQQDALFRKALKSAGITTLHFHDTRAEAIWRLSKKLDVMELARMIGHRDLKSLLLYYSASASELAKKLG